MTETIWTLFTERTLCREAYAGKDDSLAPEEALTRLTEIEAELDSLLGVVGTLPQVIATIRALRAEAHQKNLPVHFAEVGERTYDLLLAALPSTPFAHNPVVAGVEVKCRLTFCDDVVRLTSKENLPLLSAHIAPSDFTPPAAEAYATLRSDGTPVERAASLSLLLAA